MSSDGGEDTRFSGLLDAERLHRDDPDTFSIPRADVRRSLAVGDGVKLIFGYGPGERPPAERMWVQVVEVEDDGYAGRLDNTPHVIGDLAPGDLVRFEPRHVAAIWREVPGAPTADQLAIVSDRVWHDGARPVRAVRGAVPDERFSGWIVFGPGDPPDPPADLAGFGPVSHDDLAGRYRTIDSIEDEPVGSRWRWDDASLEWTADRTDA